MSGNEDYIYDIINTLDNFVSNGCGHINLQVNDENFNLKQVKLSNTTSCSLGDLTSTLSKSIEK